ncbi:MAG TPA: pseudouridine-5'-phosphate glycosidase [Gaiellaceae bacterium]|nr:pseudouridine-5'-phosphate glycosidase [Gaiellaceae bacterium]
MRSRRPPGASERWERCRLAELLRIHPEVRAALEARRAVVALETTLVSHGFPRGEGLEVAREAERRVRAAWAVPATVGVLDGVVRVGLTEPELARFAESPDARKAGPRDLGACAAQKTLGATTVGGTLAVCRVAGIGFMATGGIGGVHRGFADTLDVSADLGELAKTEALVVCSGVKSILDTRATAEALETLGVPVLGWGTDAMPLFYEAGGGPPVSARVTSAHQAAEIAQYHWRLGRHSAVVVARPPSDGIDVEPLVEAGLQEAERRGVRGPAVTPFLLSYLHEASDGRTIEVNKRLIADNAGLAGEIAVAYSRLE